MRLASAIARVAQKSQPALSNCIRALRRKPVGASMATSGLSAHPPSLSCGGAATRRFEALGDGFAGVSDFYGFTTRRSSAAGCTSAGHPRPQDHLPQRPAIGPVGGGSPSHLLAAKNFAHPQTATPTAIGAETAGPVPSLRNCRRIEKHIRNCLSSWLSPACPRSCRASLRPLARKISGGTRSDRGTDTKMILSFRHLARPVNPFIAFCSLPLISELLRRSSPPAFRGVEIFLVCSETIQNYTEHQQSAR